MIFGTLGSAESNHAMVLQRYLRHQALTDAEIIYFDDFLEAFEALTSGTIDFCLQVSVHPQHAECIARYVNRVFIVDTFIAASKPLGILSRIAVAVPQTIALQPATRHYADLSRWPTQIDETSITSVADGLLSGRYDAGLVSMELLDLYPNKLKLEFEIGPIEDAWILFGREASSQRALLP